MPDKPAMMGTVTEPITRAEYDELVRRVDALEHVGKEIAITPTSSAARRGSRLPAGWVPDDETIGKIRAEFPWLTNEQMSLEHRKFSDYWLAKAGRDAIKIDWGRTWCNWMRTATERLPRPSQVVSKVDNKVQDYVERGRRLGGE